MRKSTLYLSLAVLLLGGAVAVLWQRNGYLKEERNRYRSNTEALLSDMKRIRVDSTTMAVDVNALRLPGWMSTSGCVPRIPKKSGGSG